MTQLIDNCELPKRDNLHILFSMEASDIDHLIGRNLRRLRDARGLSQEQLAAKISTPWTRLSAYENGREGMGKDIMTRICRALNVHPWEFYVTEQTPIIRDEKEREALYTLREAEELNVAEDIARYGRFRIEEAKRQAAGSVDDRLARGRAILRKRQKKKKTA